MKNKKLALGIAVFLAIVAAWSFLTTTGVLASVIPHTLSTATSNGNVGVALTTSNPSYIYPLSSTAKGYAFKWEMTASNTGTIPWDGSWVIGRIGIKGSTITTITTPGQGGSYQVEQCASGTDVAACREDITSAGWNMQYYIGTCASGGTWITPPFNTKTATLVYGTLASGQSRTACFKVTVPAAEADGNYPLITTLQASAGGTFSIVSKNDNLAVGGISGDLTLTIVGLLSIIGSVGMFAVALV